MSRILSMIILLICIMANTAVIVWRFSTGNENPWLLLNAVAVLYAGYVLAQL